MLQKFCFLFLLFFFSCSQKNPTASNEKKPLILVSIAPYQFLAKEIAGDTFDVRSIVPSATNPHAFEPTSSQVAEIMKSDIWFRIGEPFEEKIAPILHHHNPNLIIADLREGIDLINDNPMLNCQHCSMDHLDRHIWLNPKLAKQQALMIEQSLSDKYQTQEPLFKKNLKTLLEQLSALDEEIHQTLINIPKRTILVSHPAFGYFCKEYNLIQVSVEYEGKDPRPKHLEEILKKAMSESLEVALALPQYNNKGAQLIAEKLHVPVRFIDPYSSNYFETMRKLAHIIAEPYAKDH